MKKLTKIFATVLTLSMAMSTVIMPTTAEAADNVAEFTFSAATDATTIGTSKNTTVGTQVDGFGGKDATDKVLKITGTTNRGYLSDIASSSGVVTYETSVYVEGTCEPVIHVYDGGASGYRLAMKIYQDGSVQAGSTLGSDTSIWTPIKVGATTYGTAVMNAWNKVAMEWNAAAQYVKYYLNGTCIRTETITKEESRTSFNAQFAVEPTKVNLGYIDNMRIYKEAYAPANDTMPISATGLTFLEGDMTVADAKALALDTQAGGPAAVHVYKDGVGGTEAADTETLGKDWYVVITSISGDFYRADGIYRVSSKLDCTGVTYADSTVTATVVNNGSPIESMMMVLVEDGGKFITSSEVATNVTSGATFTITGVDSLSNAEVFFVESWADLAPVMDSTFEVE